MAHEQEGSCTKHCTHHVDSNGATGMHVGKGSILEAECLQREKELKRKNSRRRPALKFIALAVAGAIAYGSYLYAKSRNEEQMEKQEHSFYRDFLKGKTQKSASLAEKKDAPGFIKIKK
jgi:type II secretory pathway component PulL